MSPPLFQGSFTPIFKAIFSIYTLTTFVDPCSLHTHTCVTQGSGDFHPAAPKPPHPSPAVTCNGAPQFVSSYACLEQWPCLGMKGSKTERPGNGLVIHSRSKPRSHHKSESYFLVTAQTSFIKITYSNAHSHRAICKIYIQYTPK